MAVLVSIWSYLWGILTALPFVGFLLVYVVAYLWKRDRRLAVRWAVNITNFLLIHAVIVAYGVIWPQAVSAWWWVVGFYLVVVGLLAWLQIKLKGKISLRKISFSTWRLTFLLFGLVYLVLFTTGIWKTMSVV
ncbi:DUF3397 domain-containing protein [Brevibacillus sp. H7]|uniref:DUF3397 domain-containing protein n=1 Tax=Brevibacillus sp. H7 TaxID=3349138 RepID=UPI00380600F5